MARPSLMLGVTPRGAYRQTCCKQRWTLYVIDNLATELSLPPFDGRHAMATKQKNPVWKVLQ